MTVLSSESRLTSTGLGTLPRVNLLPPEIAEQAAFRKVQFGLGGAVLAAVAVVGLLYVGASHSVSDEQVKLDNASAQHVALTRETAKYSSVTATYAAAEAAQAQLTLAMGEEVRYSQLLSDLSVSVPKTVWIKNLSFVQVPSSTPAAAGVGATSSSIGSFSVTGVGFSHDDLAIWLESIAGLKAYANPYFSNSTEGLIGKRKVVNFSTNATLTPSAYYTKPAGS